MVLRIKCVGLLEGRVHRRSVGVRTQVFHGVVGDRDHVRLQRNGRRLGRTMEKGRVVEGVRFHSELKF